LWDTAHKGADRLDKLPLYHLPPLYSFARRTAVQANVYLLEISWRHDVTSQSNRCLLILFNNQRLGQVCSRL